MLEVTAGGIRTKWQTHRGTVYPLRPWTLAGKRWAMIDPDPVVPSLVGESGCVRGRTCLELQA